MKEIIGKVIVIIMIIIIVNPDVKRFKISGEGKEIIAKAGDSIQLQCPVDTSGDKHRMNASAKEDEIHFKNSKCKG